MRRYAFLALLCAASLPGIERAGADWPMHRGGPQLQGRAAMPAPQKPVLKWSFKATKAIKAPAAIAKGRVFVGDDAGVIHALGLETGKALWSVATEGSIEAAPLVLDGVVYIGSSDGRLYAIDAASGAVKWKYETDDKILGGATYVRNPDGEGWWILVGGYDMLLHCIDAATGERLWTIETENYINGTPGLTSSGEVVFGGCDAFIHVVSIGERKEVRKFESGAYIAGSAAFDGGLGYVGHYGNEVLAFKPGDGAILWRYRDRAFPYYSSPALSETHLFIGGRDKRLHCIDREKGTAVWVFQTRGQVDSSPVILGDAVVVGSADGRLYCVNIADGKERWAYEIGASITASPAVGGGLIVIGAEDGVLYAIGE
jgi:outer membrane protein assembly factor BamB